MLWCTCYDTYVMIHMLWYMCYDTHVMIHMYDTYTYYVAILAQAILAQAIWFKPCCQRWTNTLQSEGGGNGQSNPRTGKQVTIQRGRWGFLPLDRLHHRQRCKIWSHVSSPPGIRWATCSPHGLREGVKLLTPVCVVPLRSPVCTGPRKNTQSTRLIPRRWHDTSARCRGSVLVCHAATGKLESWFLRLKGILRSVFWTWTNGTP